MHKVEKHVKNLIATDLTLGTLVHIKGIDGTGHEGANAVAFVSYRNSKRGSITASGHDDLREFGPGDRDLEISFWETVDGYEAFINGEDKILVEVYDETVAVKVRENMAHNAKIMLNRHLQNEGATMRRPTAPDVAELRGFDFKRWTGFREGLSAVVFDLAASTNGNI